MLALNPDSGRSSLARSILPTPAEVLVRAWAFFLQFDPLSFLIFIRKSAVVLSRGGN